MTRPWSEPQVPNEPHAYYVFGLSVRSTCVVPDLAAAEIHCDTSDVELEIALSAQADSGGAVGADVLFTSAIHHATGSPMLQIWKCRDGGGFILRHGDGTRCTVDAAGSRVSIAWPTDHVKGDWEFVLGFVASFLLMLRGTVCLHAAAVALDGEVALLVGRPGAGKSTLAAGLMTRGGQIATDDVAALWESAAGIAVQLGPPIVRPRGAALPYLSALSSQLRWAPSALRDFIEHHDVDGPALEHPIRIGSIWILTPTESSSSVALEPIASTDALVEIVADTWTSRVQPRGMRAREFEMVGRLVEESPAWRIRYSPHNQDWLSHAASEVERRHAERTPRTSVPS